MTSKDRRSKSWPDLTFGILWAGLLVSIFQMFYESPSHPIWSSVFGFPFFHHAYYLHIGLIIMWIYLRRPALFLQLKLRLATWQASNENEADM